MIDLPSPSQQGPITVWRGDVGWAFGERKLVDDIYLVYFLLEILKLSGFLLQGRRARNKTI